MADVYEVTGQTQTTLIDPGGRVVPGIEVAFRSKPSGTIASVQIPLTSFSADEVDRNVRALVNQLEAVASL